MSRGSHGIVEEASFGASGAATRRGKVFGMPSRIPREATTGDVVACADTVIGVCYMRLGTVTW
jgi:hypothetical protein